MHNPAASTAVRRVVRIGVHATSMIAILVGTRRDLEMHTRATPTRQVSVEVRYAGRRRMVPDQCCRCGAARFQLTTGPCTRRCSVCRTSPRAGTALL